MRLGVKAGLVLTLTFVLGAVVGALGAGSLRQRGERLPNRGPGPRGPGGGRGGGFVEIMERVIEPRDSAQRESLRPLFEATDRRNRAIVGGARASMRVALDSLRASLVSRVDRSQLDRFDDFARRQPLEGGGPPGLDGRGGPPPGGPPRGARP